MASRLASTLCTTLACVLAVLGCFSAVAIAQGQGPIVSGVEVPDGFQVTQVATDEVANNIYSLAVAPDGRTFVTGPGYIKILLDSDQDGVFESAQMYSQLPRSGAQGICFDGKDLLCTGDGALLKFTDADGDGNCDGPPVEIFSIKTGGEHDAHSIRKGPDGWWYLLAGNGTAISKELFASADSPVKNPRAGFLMRISPDWSEKQIYSHGFRNAYDFDFNSLGEIFVFDSDGERDVSLPWYRPTRLFRMRPGDDAGFVERSWKRPSHFFDMPPEVNALGRGSPTGVIVGQSTSFPTAFDDAIFVADWTFGRVVAFKRDANGDYDRGSEFAIANGQFGFAITDLDFANDGSLLISVGGRGTQGGVYRVSYVGSREPIELKRKPSPESNTWFETRQFITRAKTQQATCAELVEALKSSHPRRRECALEALLVDSDSWKDSQAEIAGAMGTAASHFTPRESVLLARLLPLLNTQAQQAILAELAPVQSRIVDGVFANKNGNGKVDVESLEFALNSLAGGADDSGVLARLGQLSLGGCGAKGEQAMFVGYSARNKIELGGADRRKYAGQLTKALLHETQRDIGLPDSPGAVEEIGRLAAMLSVGSGELRSAMASQLTDESAVQQDIHWLNCISKTLGQPEGSARRISEQVEAKLATALVGIGGKLVRDDLNVDRNFYPRLKTLAHLLFEKSDSTLATRVVEQLTGAESDVFLLESLPRSATLERQTVLDKFANAINKTPDWATSAQLNVLAADSSGRYLDLLRKFSGRPEFRGLIIKAVVNAPSPNDRALLVSGLGSSEFGTVKNSAIGLRRIFDKTRPEELAMSIAAARRLGWDKSSVSVRDQLMLLADKHESTVAEEIGYQYKQNKLNQSPVLDHWENWIAKKHPRQHKASFNKGRPADWQKTKNRIGLIDWDSGDAGRGSKLYVTLQCAACHDGGSRLGPKLEGISKRFSRDDIFHSILLPDQQVPERYRALVIQTVDGNFYRGSQIYDSVDGITLQQIDGTTVRINKQDIEDRVLSAKSLMPSGLLNESSDQDWSDLLEYLKTK